MPAAIAAYPRDMGRLLVVIIPLALMIYALIDCARTPEEQMPSGIPKALWILLIIFPVLGPLAWILISRIARAEAAAGRRVVWTTESPRGGRPGGPARPGRRPGPAAPDDDPEFLARLAREQRRARRAQESAGAGEAAGTGGAASSVPGDVPAAGADATRPAGTGDPAAPSADEHASDGDVARGRDDETGSTDRGNSPGSSSGS